MRRLLLLIPFLAFLLVPAKAGADVYSAWRWYVHGPYHSYIVAFDHDTRGAFVVNAYRYDRSFTQFLGHELALEMHDWACPTFEQDQVSPLVVIRANQVFNRQACREPQFTWSNQVRHVDPSPSGFVGYDYPPCGDEVTRDSDCAQFKFIRITEGPGGVIVYGPYAPLEEGRAFFRLL